MLFYLLGTLALVCRFKKQNGASSFLPAASLCSPRQVQQDHQKSQLLAAPAGRVTLKANAGGTGSKRLCPVSQSSLFVCVRVCVCCVPFVLRRVYSSVVVYLAAALYCCWDDGCLAACCGLVVPDAMSAGIIPTIVFIVAPHSKTKEHPKIKNNDLFVDQEFVYCCNRCSYLGRGVYRPLLLACLTPEVRNTYHRQGAAVETEIQRERKKR